MSANGAGSKRGRTRTEIALAALLVRATGATLTYRKKRNLPKEFSYSLETERPYDVSRREDRAALLEHYGDGHSPIFMIAVTNVRGLISDDDAILAAELCVREGRVPFIGRWIHCGVLYEDVSFALDHGASDELVKRTLLKYGQKAALVVTREECSLVYADDA